MRKFKWNFRIFGFRRGKAFRRATHGKAAMKNSAVCLNDVKDSKKHLKGDGKSGRSKTYRICENIKKI